MKKRLYIAYGSNLNLRQMAMRCPTANLVGTGIIENYELQFKGMPHGAFATIGVMEGAHVPVCIWELRVKDEYALDVYEGFPHHYYKSSLSVLMNNGDEITAMGYIMNPKMHFGIPTQRYYNTVYEGYKNCSLDVNILNDAVDKSIERYRVCLDQKYSATLFEDKIKEGEIPEQEDQEEADEQELDDCDRFFSSDQMHF